MKKHFMCTYTSLNNNAKRAFEYASTNMSDREIFEMMKRKKAEMLGHWREDKDFSFVIGMQKTKTASLSIR